VIDNENTFTTLIITGAGHKVIIDGQGQHRIFDVTSRDRGATNPIITIENLELVNGRADQDGGGAIINRAVPNGMIITNFPGEVKIDRVTISGSVTDFGVGGGGIYNQGGNTEKMTITNSTIAGNCIVDSRGICTLMFLRGAGIFNEGPMEIISGGTLREGRMEITNSTIARNLGGGIQNNGTMDIGSTIVVNSSTFVENDFPNCNGNEVGNLGVNISNDSSCNFGTSIGANGRRIGDDVNPELVVESGSFVSTTPPSLPIALNDNGGFTRTIALRFTSPAIDAGGSCESTDQRDFPRNGLCDIGAFERQPIDVVSDPVDLVEVNGTRRIVGSSFSFDATLTNLLVGMDPQPSIGSLSFRVIEISGGNTFSMYTPTTLPTRSPRESVRVTFTIQLATLQPFTFRVSVFGAIIP
jgi:hypothetical protein